MESSVLPYGGIDAASARLETGIRQLKVQYDMFFAGALDREPIELRHELERIIKHFRADQNLKYHERFRFNALVARFNSFSELWGKTVRSHEEGSRRGAAALDSGRIREKLVARCRVSDPNRDEDSMRRLYSRFLEARESAAPGSRAVPYENFVRGVASQTARLQKSSGCAEIELRLVVSDQKVQLKARPGK